MGNLIHGGATECCRGITGPCGYGDEYSIYGVCSIIVYCPRHDNGCFVLLFNVYGDNFQLFRVNLGIVYNIAQFICDGVTIEFNV